MQRATLRRRLHRVLVQWLLLFLLAAGVVVVLSFLRVREHVVDNRLLLGRTIAHSLDATVSTAMQDLGRLASELSRRDGDVAGRLRIFRFQSVFREATYVLDERGRVVAADPAEVRPLPVFLLRDHESVTPLVRKPDAAQPAVLAIIQPFRSRWGGRYLISEMNPVGSAVSAFLQDLGADPETHVAVLDEHGVVIASADPRQLFRTAVHVGPLGERIRAHRPLVTEEFQCEVAPEDHEPTEALTVMVPLRFAPWGVVVQQHHAEAFASLYTARRGLLLAGLMLPLTGFLLARALSRSVVSPIRRLSEQAERIRAGDLASPIAVSGDHEVEVLGQTLDDARGRLASTLEQLRALNEDLEGQVASRAKVIEAKYGDLRLLHAVAELSTRERQPDRIAPEILQLIAQHYALPVAALVTRPPEGPATTHVIPPGTVIPWLAGGQAPPPDWQRREAVYQGQVRAELFYPRAGRPDEEVLGALDHQLAASLHGAYLWKQIIVQDEQRQLLVRRLLRATEEERRRLARELHDEISQLLTVIQLSLEHATVDSAELRKAKALLAQTQTDIHRIIYDLRPSLLDDLGLSAAMQSYAQEHLVRHGMKVSLEIEEALPSRPEIETATFRIYQEIVTNILRHARAENVSIELYERERRLVLAVEDDGVGFDPGERREGAGITGMRERAALVNGSIRVDSEPGMGTHVVVEIPLA